MRSPWALEVYDERFQIAIGHFIRGAPRPTRMSKVTDGASKTMMIAEKHVRFDLYEGNTASDDRGWSDGWDPDTMRCTCVQPLSDAEWHSAYTAAPPQRDPPSWYNMVLGSANTGGFNAVFADGSVHTVSYDIDIVVLNSLGTQRSDRKSVV